MRKKVFTLAELALHTQSSLVGDPSYQISNVADLESAGAEDASFLSNSFLSNYEKAMHSSQAGVVFISPQVTLLPGRNFLVTDDPSRAFQSAIEAFLGDNLRETSGFKGIHPSAVVHDSASIGHDVTIGPHAVIEKNAVIGDNTILGAGCYVGLNVTIGSHCHIYPNATIRERCQIGNRVILQPGAVIGSCGFGYTTDNKGHHTKLNQVGIVIIEDDVEIGANTTIDRSRFKATVIGRGTKIDNLVQIAHGVVIGQDNIIVSQTGIAGSTKTGNWVVIGGQVAVTGHITIGDKVMIAARTGISKSITEPGKYGGLPAVPLKEYQRNSVYLRNIEAYVKEIKELQDRLSEMEQKIKRM